MAKANETPLQFRAGRAARQIELAKVAIMAAQEELALFRRKSPADLQQLTESAFAKLDRAWVIAKRIIQEEDARIALRKLEDHDGQGKA